MKQNIYDNPIFFEQYTALRDSGITANDFVEQPALKSLISSLEGKMVLDLGCGAGSFAKYCVENGASKVIAVDISKNMIEKARKENQHESINYLCSPIEEVELHNQSFDVIVSSLAIHYIEDYPKLIDRVISLLTENGEFVFSTEHPMVTARKEEISNWVKDSEGNKLHWALDHYQEEGKREGYWYIDGVVKYHRTISTLVNTLIEKGLVVERIIEPISIPGGVELRPKLINEERRPSFIVIKAKKN
ncbi:bifunctional 2-polyprenyl-6-hydroxyphenol methylase/3-demethylubiquinol 3-O-methyltransferase UbiG [Lysinibacillus sp. SGAir0095]|uniref:class I SAM-dependent methyltransferase n=1 Tax=Lysinibacillus sp. SGAir0095 TaxID=2070463 RepID=UPI0010CCB91E|nr:class I SAM-dependent methyltransferase [Lysinibacillus sp. SGAir0095]QCR31285.1 SAM-dependent methyltransferase [Lysinibacillus sp. SGAir0095]